MRIAILSRYQNINQRGVESFVIELTKRLPQDWQVDILTGKESDSLGKMISGNYDIIMPLNGRLQSLKASVGRLFSPYKQSLKFSLRSNYKLIIGGHSGVGFDDIFNLFICKPDIFIALTDYQIDNGTFRSLKNWNWGSELIKINNGVDLDKFSPQGKTKDVKLNHPVVLSVGALNWYKHHEYTIEAISKLPNVSLLIVGSGVEEEKLRSLGEEKLGDRFKIEKYPYQLMPQVYRGADLFTLPSWDREAFGIVYLEAMACNLAVVAPNDAPRREIVGDGGILTDVKDSEKYTNSIKQALEKKWGNIPRRQAEKFSWEKVAKEYEQCFKSLLQKNT